MESSRQTKCTDTTKQYGKSLAFCQLQPLNHECQNGKIHRSSQYLTNYFQQKKRYN